MTEIGQTTPNQREWWSQQWLDLLDKYRFKKRLERARDYARQGNVLKIEFKDQKVFARVQGTQAEPYQVSLWLDTFRDEEWGYVIETLSQKALFSARLLAGEMPPDIENVFASNGLRLFPFTLEDVHARCSCPDKANPCKHIAAIYYLLGDRFSEDPFVLFQLRGRTQPEIITALRQFRHQVQAETTETESEVIAADQNAPIFRQAPDFERFWRYSEQLESDLVVITPAPTAETVLDRLGPISLRSVSTANAENSEAESLSLMKSLEGIYQAVSQQAISKALS
ncbi:MAG: SWIM zinc finger family protein [Microcoleaceae cyanobacterium]